MNVARAKKRLWKVFSEYIRTREADDNGFTKCFTCGVRKHWKELDAGHYIPKSVGGFGLYFSEQNVNAQCTSCNRFRHGNLHEYALRLQEKYGGSILQWLAAQKGTTKMTASEIELLIKHYKNKLNARRNNNTVISGSGGKTGLANRRSGKSIRRTD